MTDRMRVISQQIFGGPEVLEVVEVDRPTAGAGEALVRVQGASVNAGDLKIRAGLLPRFGDPPFTLGLDFSGTVEAVSDEAGRVKQGDRVYGCSFPPRGSYAEYVAVPVTMLAAAPRTIDLVSAADAGQRVLIHAAAGGVGHLAVQIAKARGAHVICTAREDKHAFLRALGADELIDYTTSDFAQLAHDIDLVLDPISGDYGLRSLNTLKPGGLLLDVRGTGPDRGLVREQAEARGLRFVEFGFSPSGDDLEQITQLVESGDVRVAVDHVFPLRDAVEAHALSESGRVRGKLVLAVSADGQPIPDA
jgi:NADPH:quinone reductase-like Zn-dependent oxidoreductase